MSAVPQHSPSTAPPPRANRAGHAVRLVLALLLLLPGLALLTAGGTALWVHHLDRADGFVFSPSERFASQGSALVSQGIDLQAVPRWLELPPLGTARLEVTGRGTDDVFVGIARVDDVTTYLDGVSRTVVEGLGFDDAVEADDQVLGGSPPAPPVDQDFWIAEVTGSGRQQINWKPADGEWMFVIMNADGSPGVDVQARIGAELPSLGGLGWLVLAAGGIVTALAVMVLPVRRRRPDPWPPVAAAHAAGPRPDQPSPAGSPHR